MFGSRKNKQNTKKRLWPFSQSQSPEATNHPDAPPSDPVILPPEQDNTASSEDAATVPNPAGFFSRIRAGLGKTRNGLVSLFIGKKEIDDDLLEALETQLLLADVGVAATCDIINDLTQKVAYKELDDTEALMSALKQHLNHILAPSQKHFSPDIDKPPYVILIVGVNGAGKTTSIGKLAHYFQQQGKRVMLAAGDTFRAAAVEQLQAWGEKNAVPVIAQSTGSDSASVIFDAVAAATARKMDVLIADTAGRLHNKAHLMDELAKIRRVITKHDAQAPHATLLVVDASTGQNALSQAKLFHESIGLSGLILTKLDGTAKGGIAFALAKQTQLPIHFIGIGERIDDLRPFKSDEFIAALLDSEHR